MTKEQIRRVLDRVSEWPIERQADLAEIAMLMEAQDNSNLRLTKDQVQGVARRLSQPDSRVITLAEFSERLRRRYGA